MKIKFETGSVIPVLKIEETFDYKNGTYQYNSYSDGHAEILLLIRETDEVVFRYKGKVKGLKTKAFCALIDWNTIADEGLRLNEPIADDNVTEGTITEEDFKSIYE